MEYRISVKALVLNDENKFLLVKEDNGLWELPGGGLDFGEDPRKGLEREISEEMGLKVTYVSDEPVNFITWKSGNVWKANVIYRASLEDLDFVPSDECVEVRFFTVEEALKEKLFSNVKKFLNNYKYN